MKEVDVVRSVQEAMETSELVRAVSAIRKEGAAVYVLGAVKPTSLSKATIAELEANGNVAEDWNKVNVVPDFDPSRVRNVCFFGNVVLGKLDGKVQVEDGVELLAGIYNSTVVNCCIGNNVLISDVKLLANYVVKEGAVLLNDGTICTKPGATFGNELDGDEFEDGLPIAIETGGREVKVYAEIAVDVAEKIAKSRSDKALIERYEEAVGRYVAAVRSDVGIIEQGAMIRNTRNVSDTYVGPYAVVDNAAAVVNTTLLSNGDEKVEILNGAYVGNSLIQWGSEAATMAIVESSVLTEHSHVERHGKVTGSLLGPNTGVAEGEVTACLLGPFVGFHHQALLIAALWPEGKGNVAYGANIGSNHTSKAPDQEIWPGEGMFFGLGANIKFPADFTRAPYSIIASGASTLPQQVTFPFSLINVPAAAYEGISPAFNEITPAWLLTDNMFTLRRNEGKYKARNKARRTQFDFDVFRPDTVELMLDARRRLQEVKEVKALYTDKDILGLGKNYMLEKSRQPAIEAYTFYIRYYALLGLMKKAEEVLAAGGSVSDLLSTTLKASLSTPSDDPILRLRSGQEWEHQRKILRAELKDNDVAANLKLLREMQEKVAQDVEESKAKDDRRGRRIIEDYEVAHKPADKDKFVIQTWEETKAMQAKIDALLNNL